MIQILVPAGMLQEHELNTVVPAISWHTQVLPMQVASHAGATPGSQAM